MNKYKSDIGLVISDLHLGETVEAAQVQGLNEVNQKILGERFRYTFNNAIHLLDHHVGAAEFGTLHLCYAGDMVNGVRHLEAEQTNDLTVMEQVQAAMDLMVYGATTLGMWCKSNNVKLRIHCVVGNHGDLAIKHPAKNHFGKNLDWLAYWQAYEFSNKKLIKLGVDNEWDIPDSLGTDFKIGGRLFRLLHGHTPGQSPISGRGDGPLGPAGPLCRFDSRQRRQASSVPGRQAYETLICGHWHHYHATDTVIGNGSIVGYNEFAMGLGFGYAPPVQAMFLVHPIWGITHQIKVHSTKKGSTIL